MSYSAADVAALVTWGKESPANKKQLQDWKTEAIIASQTGSGGAILSGSANGVSFSQIGDMPTRERVTFLDQVLKQIAANLTPSSRTYGRII